jgi:hypothetical protein
MSASFCADRLKMPANLFFDRREPAALQSQHFAARDIHLKRDRYENSEIRRLKNLHTARHLPLVTIIMNNYYFDFFVVRPAIVPYGV